MQLSITTRPFYFGNEGELFGILDSPEAGASERGAIVMCQPIGHEYVWAHRAFRQLSARLAALGYTVLRFDYFGCGDSLGEGDEADLQRWIEDVRTAIRYMSARHGQPCVVGLRLGASMALLAGSGDEAPGQSVVWQPIVFGADYLKDLRALHLEHERKHGDPSGRSARTDEALGFRLSRRLQSRLAEFDLSSAGFRPPRQLMQLVNTDGTDQAALKARCESALPDAFHWEYVEESKAWSSEPYKMAMPVKSISSIVDWVVEHVA